MSDSGWRQYTALGLGVAAFAALFLTYVLVNEPGEADYYEEATKEHPHHTLQNVPDASVPIISTGQPFPRYPEAKWKEWQEQQDLKAQRQMAYWAKYAGIAALLSIGVALTGVFLVKQTLDANREAVDQAAVSAEHSKRSADTAERALRGLERPYLFAKVEGRFYLNHVPPSGGGHGPPQIQMRPGALVNFTNYGKLPAILTSLSVEFDHLPALPQEIRHIPNVILDPNEVFVAGETTRNFDRYLGFTLEGPNFASLFAGRSFVWFYGLLTYESPTGDQFETEFCWYYNGLTSRFGRYHLHNRRT